MIRVSYNMGLQATVAVHKMMLLGTPTKSGPKGTAAIRLKNHKNRRTGEAEALLQH
jgi:hypothetical protein